MSLLCLILSIGAYMCPSVMEMSYMKSLCQQTTKPSQPEPSVRPVLLLGFNAYKRKSHSAGGKEDC